MDLSSLDLSKLSIDDTNKMMETVVEISITYGFSLIGAVLTLVIGWWLAAWVKRVSARGLSKIKNADATLTDFISSLLRYIVLAATLMAVLDRFGVETTSLIAVFGAAGLAIGLAVQGTLSNVAAGVMLLIFRPFKAGHFIDAGGKSGTVRSLGLFTTELSTIDNIQIFVPNASIWGSVITNFSYNKTRRHDITVGIDYGDDINLAMRTMEKILKKDKRVLADPAPQIMVMELGDSSVDVNARFWTESADFWQVKWDMTKAFKEGFDAAGLTIPFPQRTVHMVQTAPAKKTVKKAKKK